VAASTSGIDALERSEQTGTVVRVEVTTTPRIYRRETSTFNPKT
jgi:hypothetical protein